ncbi:MAG: SDR family oxidoreductase [Deltaproteobacteria bacterium]|nr:SDR family oxidoreductase [Deltaproteobacteria bacterium]
MDNKSDGRVVLITGASSGIGKACAQHLHGKGLKVYGTSRKGPKPWEASAEPSASDHSDSFEMLGIDVSNDDAVQGGIRYILEKEGRLDIVINNAGVGIAGALEDVSMEECRSVFETNLYGIIRVCQAVIPTMREQKSGYIINVGSLGGLFGMPFDSIYCASKHAVEGLTETLRMEIKQFGIKTVLIEPGDIDTGISSRTPSAEKAQTNPVYLDIFNKVCTAAVENESDGSPSETVALLVERIINTASPRLRYKVGPAFQKVTIPLKRILPQGAFEWIIMKNYNMIG